MDTRSRLRGSVETQSRVLLVQNTKLIEQPKVEVCVLASARCNANCMAGDEGDREVRNVP